MASLSLSGLKGRVEGNVGYGELGVGGWLGYTSSETGDRVLLPDWQSADEVISAHVPSDLTLTIDQPVRIAGAMAASFGGDPCRFWVDWHCLGTLHRCCQSTHWITLPAGTYRLRIALCGSASRGHTLWLLRACEATPRLGLATIGCFPENELADALFWLFTTAARAGIFVHVHGVNERLGNWFSRKIESLRGFIASLPACYDMIAYLDGTDSIVLAEEREWIEKLPVPTIGAEACSWPAHDAQWEAYWQEHSPVEEAFPQAAAWGGPREPLLGVLDKLIDWHYAAKAGQAPEWAYANGKPLSSWWDDQFVWQAAIRDGLDVRVDHYWQVFGQMACTQTDLQGDRLTCREHRVITRHNTMPVALHFSTPGRRLIPLWAGFLGLA